MLKHILFSLTAVFFFVITLLVSLRSQVNALSVTPSVPVPTVEYAMPYPGILPTHPLYPVKLWRDKLLIWFTRSELKKAELHLLLSDKRIVMAQSLWDDKLFDQSLGILEDAEMNILYGVMRLGEYKKEYTIPPGVVDKFELANKKHTEMISAMASTTDNQNYKNTLQRILSITHQTKAQLAALKP